MHPLAIDTAHLRLRPCTLDDVHALHRLWTDPDVRRYLWDDQVIPRETAVAVVTSSEASFAAHGFGQWIVLPKDSDALIGFCGLRPFSEPPEVELLYGLHPSHWGQGLATEAAHAVLRYGFEACHLDRIFAGADPPNAASFRVIERLGMTFAKRMQINGLDAIYYAIARREFRPDLHGNGDRRAGSRTPT